MTLAFSPLNWSSTLASSSTVTYLRKTMLSMIWSSSGISAVDRRWDGHGSWPSHPPS